MAKGQTPLPPAGDLEVTERIRETGKQFHRMHDEGFDATEFNDSGNGNARFSPIRNSMGAWVPTLYGGGTFACAAMEVPFRDVPFEAGFKTIEKGKLQKLVYSMVEPTRDLHLADLTNTPLRRLGISRARLIDTDKDQYPATRKWAEAIHDRCTSLQGVCWTSRQDDTQLALMLFGDRIRPGALKQIGESRSLTSDPGTYSQLLDVADIIAVKIVPGK